MVVYASLDYFTAGIPETVLQSQPRPAFRQPNRLPINVAITRSIGKRVSELNPVASLADDPLPGIYNLVGMKRIVLLFVRLAHHAHSNANECVARLGLRVT